MPSIKFRVGDESFRRSGIRVPVQVIGTGPEAAWDQGAVPLGEWTTPRDKHGEPVGLVPGPYTVRADLPSGVGLTSICVTRGQDQDIQLEIDSQLPREWRRWAPLLRPPEPPRHGGLASPALASLWLRLWQLRGDSWWTVPWPRWSRCWRRRDVVGYRIRLADRPHLLQIGGLHTPGG